MVSIIFAVIAVLCLGYYIFAASYAGIHSAFLWFWLMAGIGCIVISVGAKIFVKYNILQIIPKWIKVSVVFLLVCVHVRKSTIRASISYIFHYT